MSWQDRINEFILLVSPSGLNFYAYWVGDKRTLKKKLGIFEFPAQRGAIVQDLDVGPKEYPLTFYFEGKDNDINAERFFSACNERGPWTVTHPTKGNLVLQLVSVTEDIQPVTSGNITQFSTEWIEVGLNLDFVSAGQLSAAIADKVYDVKAALGSSVLQKIKNAVAQVAAFTSKVLAASTALYAKYNEVMTVYQTIQSTVSNAVASVASLVGVVTTIISAPADVLRDIKSRFGYYKSTISTAFSEMDSAIGKLHTGPDKAAAASNIAVASSIVAAACLNGMARSISDNGFTNREEALSYLTVFNDTFSEVMVRLDAVQTSFADVSIAKQYTSYTETFNDLVQLRQLVNNLVLRLMFDLSTTKYVTLQSNRAPVEIAITEGVDFDRFIAANQLHGSDILLLPAGRIVAVNV